MNLMDTAQLLGNFGEFVGAIAVVATLVYLAFQVKHSKESLDANTKAIKGQAISDVTRNVHDHMHMLVRGHDMAASHLRFAADETLDSLDAFLNDALLTAIFMARQNEFFQWKQGLLDESVFKSLHHVILVLVGSHNGHDWWEHEGRRMVAPEFIDFVDDLCSKSSGEDLQAWKQLLHIEDAAATEE